MYKNHQIKNTFSTFMIIFLIWGLKNEKIAKIFRATQKKCIL